MSTNCKFEGCTKNKYAKGWCPPHYMQAYRGEELRPLVDRSAWQTEKRCTACDEIKPREAFYTVHKSTRLASECKDCTLLRRQKHAKKVRYALQLLKEVEGNR